MPLYAWLVVCGGRLNDSTHAPHRMSHNIGLHAPVEEWLSPQWGTEGHDDLKVSHLDPQVLVTDVLVAQLKEVLGKDAPMAVTPGVVHEKDSRGFWTTSITSGKGKINFAATWTGRCQIPEFLTFCRPYYVNFFDRHPVFDFLILFYSKQYTNGVNPI